MIQLPLDLSDAQLMSEGQTLEDAVTSLDENGWNQRGLVQHCTFSRIFVAHALITEEILEISMGMLTKEEIALRAADIETRATEEWNALPSFLRANDEQFIDMMRPPVELLFLAYIRLDHLLHYFMLQRTLIKKVGADSTKLLG